MFRDIVLDFWKSIEQFGPIAAALANCSNDRYYCAHGDIVHIVLPKNCKDIEASEWSVGSTKTMVLATEREPGADTDVHPWGSGTILMLGNPQYPNVVYEYDRGIGVRGFYYDLLGKIDFVSMAKNHQIAAYRSQNPRGTYFGLTSLDHFGRCRKDSELQSPAK